jgi:hypothetical protein
MCLQSFLCVHKPHSNLHSPCKHFKSVLAVKNQLFFVFYVSQTLFFPGHSMLRKQKDQNGMAKGVLELLIVQTLGVQKMYTAFTRLNLLHLHG